MLLAHGAMRCSIFMPLFVCAVLFLRCGSAAAGSAIPFDYCDGLIWVKVNAGADGAVLNFLLDSGAGASVLNLQTARRLGVKLGEPEKVRRVGAGAEAWRVKDFHASVGGVPVATSLLALDLSATSAECSRTIDGLLGEDFFRGRIVEIDFKARCVRFLDKASEGGCCAVMPVRVEHEAMCVPVSVNGAEVKWARLDTGCDEGLHWVASTGGNYMRASVQLGRERITNVKTALHRSPIFPAEAGLLGNGVLSNYRVTIDWTGRRVMLART